MRLFDEFANFWKTLSHFMKSLSSFQKQRCLKVMDELDSYKSFTFYREPVDPIRDNCPDYFDVISNPMDLSTVRNKLKQDKYTSISQWKSDVNLIWKNCIEYNQHDFIFVSIARQFQDTFTSLSQKITDNEISDWKNRLGELEEKLRFLNSARPDHLPKPYLSREELEANMMARYTSTTDSKDTSDEMKSISQPYFSPEDAIKLAEEVNKLEDDEDVIAVINLIRDSEPKLEIGEDVDLKIEDLSISTLVALRQMLNKFKRKRLRRP